MQQAKLWTSPCDITKAVYVSGSLCIVAPVSPITCSLVLWAAQQLLGLMTQHHHQQQYHQHRITMPLVAQSR